MDTFPWALSKEKEIHPCCLTRNMVLFIRPQYLLCSQFDLSFFYTQMMNSWEIVALFGGVVMLSKLSLREPFSMRFMKQSLLLSDDE